MIEESLASTAKAQLVGIFDASQTDKQTPRWLTIGGYVATQATWDSVWQTWEACLRKWNLGRFSTAAVISGPSSERRGRECLADFRSMVATREMWGVSVSLNLDDWSSLPRDPYRDGLFPRPYHFAFSMLLNLLATNQRVQNFGAPTPMLVKLDTDEEAERAALDYLRRAWLEEDELFADIEFTREAAVPAIQIADMCAGAIRKFQVAGGMETMMTSPLNRDHQNGARHSMSSIWSIDDIIRAAEAVANRELTRQDIESHAKN